MRTTPSSSAAATRPPGSSRKSASRRWCARRRSSGTSWTACRWARDDARGKARARLEGAPPIRPDLWKVPASLSGEGTRAERDRREHPQAVRRRAVGEGHRRAPAARVHRSTRTRAREGCARIPRRDGQARPVAGERVMPAPRPYTLVAELTYACPLRCAYCSNPADFAGHHDALDTEGWRRVLREAEQLGVVQVNFTGGEPLLRPDLEALIEEAHELDLYSNL